MNELKSIEINQETTDSDMQAWLSYLNPVYSSDRYNIFTDSITLAQTNMLNSLAQQNLEQLTMKNQKFPYGKACSYCKHLVLHGEVDMHLLQQAVEGISLVSLYIQYIEKIRQYQPVKSSQIKVIREALYPAQLCDFALELQPEQLETLKINNLRGALCYYYYLLHCKRLSYLELPFFTDDAKEITLFILRVFANNPSLYQLKSYFGEVMKLQQEGFLRENDDERVEGLGHRRFHSHIRTFSQQVLEDNSIDSKLLESKSDDDFTYDMIRARQKLALVRYAQSKAGEILQLYQSLLEYGILVDEASLGISVLCITADRKYVLLHSAKERGPQYVIENKAHLKGLKIKISQIVDYYSGSPEEPMNHSYLTLSCGRIGYRFKVKDFANYFGIETQDQSIAFVEIIRDVYGLEVLYGNIICKYLNKKYPGEFELLL